MCESYPKTAFAYFADEAFSKREAWCWLIKNATNGKICGSIRYMAAKWKWHRSKVARFIHKLEIETLIETAIKRGKLAITICNYESFVLSAIKKETISEAQAETCSRQNQDKAVLVKQERDRNEHGQSQENSSLSASSKTFSRQEQDGFGFGDIRDNGNKCKAQEYPTLTGYTETISRQIKDTEWKKEEKKKSTKKRKQEKIKEKNIPYRDTKKEKIAAFVPVQLVTESDVEEWVEQNLPIPIDLSWELGKFKDYWLTAQRKPPKNAIAAFRNWLRKSVEFKHAGAKSALFNQNRSSGIQNFIAAASELAAKYAGQRLDKDYAQATQQMQEDKLYYCGGFKDLYAAR
jgi:hypothetical protein